MRIRHYGPAICVIAALAISGTAHASLTTFTGFDSGAGSTDPRPNSNAAAAAFDAAAGAIFPVSIITFESAPLGAFTNLTVAPGVTINGTDISSNPQTVQNTPVGNPDALFGYNTTSGGSQFVSLFGGTVTFSFATPVQFFGGYFSGDQVAGETITFDDGSPQSITIPESGSGGVGFVGFIDSAPGITSVTVNTPIDLDAVDDVRVPGASVAPEASSLVLLAAPALFGVVLIARRKRVAR